MTEPPQLARRIGFSLLIFYGLGTILGAGIYVLIGKVVANAGMLAPLSFLAAAAIVWVTSLSYSQMTILFPQSAGEAVYAEKGFGMRWLTLLVGCLIIATGAVSSATLVNGLTGYVNVFFELPHYVIVLIVVVVLGLLAAWGIAESMKASAVITLVEIAGLVFVIFLCGDVLPQFPDKMAELFVPSSGAQLAGVFTGAFLAFYAFVGFEDMVNVVEEVKDPTRTMPKAIRWALVITTVLYLLVAVVAVLSLPVDKLAESEAPLALLLEGKRFGGAKTIALISLFAIINGVLIQMIMASRVLYGMAVRGHVPKLFGRVHPSTKTPIIATVLICCLIVVLSLWLPLVALAEMTSFIILTVFTVVNLSLYRIRKMPQYQGKLERRTYPVLGAVLCVGLIVLKLLY